MATFKEIGKNKVQIDFEIEREKFNESMNKSYLKNRGKYQVPGFRKGKAPRTVLEKYYGEGLFLEDAFDDAFPEAYQNAVKELDLFVVSRPENVDIVSMEEGENLKITAEVYIKPEVELGSYKDIEVEYEDIPLAEDAITREIDAARESNARFESVERAVENGDRVILDYSGSVDGKKFEGGTAEAQTLDIGSNTFIPGFEKQLVGMKKDEQKDIEVTFPEEYHEKSLAGKPAVFAIKINDVKEKIVPEADDDFAQDVSEFDTFEEYRKDVEEKLIKQNAEQNKMRLESAIIEKIVADSNVDIPAPMVETQIDNEIQEMSYNLAYQGITMDDYLKYVGQTMDGLRNSVRNAAEHRVKTQLVLDAIKDKEQIKAGEEELNDLFKEFADAQKKTIEEIKKDLDADSMEYIENRAAFDALGNYLIKNAKTVAPKKEEEKKEEEASEEA
ncbi:MAG: trigger factor [Clostridia bacterium]|nr:trigger factor [Clostridia bacterium]